MREEYILRARRKVARAIIQYTGSLGALAYIICVCVGGICVEQERRPRLAFFIFFFFLRGEFIDLYPPS